MNVLSKQILCTLGPASMNDQVIQRMEQLGVSLFRINLSHTKLRDLPRVIDFIRARTSVPICLDTEGAQVRTGDLVDGSIQARENAVINVHRRRVPGDSSNINLHPANIVDRLENGDFLSIDFNSVLAQVIERERGVVAMRVLNGGVIGQNKAVTIERDVELPPLTEKDIESIAIGRKAGITHFALSFANKEEDIAFIRDLTGSDAFIISKIESLQGVANLEAIARASEAILIDRGDLSRQVPIEQIPRTQKSIIATGKATNTTVYVATNLLESMVVQPAPTRAEVNDIYNTLLDGADGLVLAAETAIGNFPVECASMVVKMIRDFETGMRRDEPYYHDDPVSLLVEPHGGALVHREAGPDARADIDRLPTITVPDTILMDCEQIALGTYSPLAGFMGRDDLDSVLKRHRLASDTVWTMPVLLQVDRETVARFGKGDRIALKSRSGTVHAVLDVDDIFQPDMGQLVKGWFGTESADHPGVARVLAGGDTLVGGSVALLERLPSPYRHYELTPAQTRFIFTRKGWSRVVGFHTRNPVHRGHEAIQLAALKKTGADGLYINPVIGPKKKGDFLPGPIMRSYQAMLEFRCYPPNTVVLGSFATYSRYAGPREAVFTALARKNMGCSQFIIGRDHTGVGSFYGPDDNRKLFDSLGDIGIAPVIFDAVGYDRENDRYGPRIGKEELLEISGTRIRTALQSGEPLPDWIMRDVVQEALRAEAAETGLFVE